ncbi:transposase family protein [Kaistella sp.]|uniref:transposase family protein n=1 Tax=Kaistella sp. TaxID=2782235 RepID=UPI003C6FA685
MQKHGIKCFWFVKSKEIFSIAPNGIPSKHTINKVFSAIDSEQFESCFTDWIPLLI